MVGLDKLKLAILINAINPKVGGLLIRGPKGSGKTTIVRSLTDILPKIKVVKGCLFNCSPTDPSNMCPKCRDKHNHGEESVVEEREMVVVDLPLGATEDRVVGSLDVEKAIKLGIEALEPGILAEANQNVLYVDEVNLLPDHIADDLLDAAATGWNIVEREGISVSHPSKFVFIGTMNPEEGELRPQLLDRFALSANVGNMTSAADRVEVVRRNIEFEADPEKFQEKFKLTQDELRRRISQAEKMLKDVVMPPAILEGVCKACLDLKVDGLRPDIVIAKAASTLAAFENRTEPTLDDVLVAAELALSHRTREGGFVEPATPQEIVNVFAAQIKKAFEFQKTGETPTETEKKRRFLKGKSIFWVKDDATKKQEDDAMKGGLLRRLLGLRDMLHFYFNRLFRGVIFGLGKRAGKGPDAAPATESLQTGSNKLKGQTFADEEQKKKGRGIPIVSNAVQHSELSQGHALFTSIAKRITSPSNFFLRMGKLDTRRRTVHAGRHAQSVTTLHRGKPYGWRIPQGKPTDIHFPATIRQAARYQTLRQKPFETALAISLRDIREKMRMHKASLTMVFVIDVSGSMIFNLRPVKEALLKLHGDAYRSRDRVGIVALKGLGAEVVQHPVTNLKVVANKLLSLHISGHTPLAAGMSKGYEVLKEAKKRDPAMVPVMVIVTDGNANVPLRRSPQTGEIREVDEIKAALREYERQAELDVTSVSNIIRREGIQVIVVNTNPHAYGRETYGLGITQRIAAITGGSHHAIGALTTEEDLVQNMITQIREDERSIVSDKMHDRLS
jgi:magnesium chelatase subunit D